jgi:hypothetical protein
VKHLKRLIITRLKRQGKLISNNRIILFINLFFSYPLILSIELQCSLSQQERLAQLLIDIFGEKIFLDHLINDTNMVSTEYRSLPSPNDLRGKIIIKVKEKKTFCFSVRNVFD